MARVERKPELQTDLAFVFRAITTPHGTASYDCWRCASIADPGFAAFDLKPKPPARKAEVPSREAAEADFERLYQEHLSAVLAYGLRRTSRPEDAGDLAAETFLVAWRRRADVPEDGAQARAWLYGVARRVLANHRRGERRRDRLAGRLREDLAAAVAWEQASRVEPAAMKAMRRMEERDRELLMLAGWEELGPSEIADVLGISSAAVRSRLHRARKKFRIELEAQSVEPEPSPTVEPEEAC
jgi:RNA polymerase sigma-70 factor (ECF subfamily)